MHTPPDMILCGVKPPDGVCLTHYCLLGKKGSDTKSKEAGLIRALTRTTAVVYRTIVFGSLPRHVRCKGTSP